MYPAKYLVYKTGGLLGSEYIIIFGATVKHDSIWTALSSPSKELVSAGSIAFNIKDRVHPMYGNDPFVQASCFGESTTLGVSARKEEDSELANLQLNLRGAY